MFGCMYNLLSQAPPIQWGGVAWLAGNEGSERSQQASLAQVSLAQLKSISSPWVKLTSVDAAAAELGGPLPHGQRSSPARLAAARGGSARQQGSRPHAGGGAWLGGKAPARMAGGALQHGVPGNQTR